MSLLGSGSVFFAVRALRLNERGSGELNEERADDTLQSWTSRIAWACLVGMVSGGVLWAGWLTNSLVDLGHEVRGKPSTEEVVELVITRAPYTQDKRLIDETLAQTRDLHKGLKQTIEANTRAIIKLEAILDRP